MSTLDDVGVLCRTYLAHLRLPAETIEGPGYRAARQDRTPRIYMVNHMQVDPGLSVEVDALFAFFEGQLGHHEHRFVITVPSVDPILQARLVEADFRPEPVWQGRLQGKPESPPPPESDVRPGMRIADRRPLLAQADRTGPHGCRQHNGPFARGAG